MKRPETTKNDYQPGAAADANIRKDGSLWTLVFVRPLRHPPGKVWRALTDPENLREWAPFDANRNLGSTGAAMLTLVGGTTPEVSECEVRRAEAPRLLEYTWGESVLRWELEPIESGTRLTLRQTLGDPTWLPKVAAGWHICLDVAERALDGHPVGRILAGEAKRFGWERLNAEYAQRFGVENTGWPEDIG
ncbi:MAG TPA: SRPBCC family protein [Vicinamibacteria bacterium]|nr:SRPBCC family protein [Vicinamibacteria bacterium]